MCPTTRSSTVSERAFSVQLAATARGAQAAARGLRSTCGRALRIAGFLLAALLSGCDDYWFGDGTEVVADVVTPEGVQSGQVSIDFILSGDASEADVDASYSTNGGLTFHRATPADGGDGTRGLSVSGMGEFHTFVWDSAEDLAGRRVSRVRVRISPEDGDSGRSEPFAVHNALWVTALKESRRELNLYSLDIHTGDLTSRNTVSTPESGPCDVLFFEDRFLVAHHESDLIAMFKVEEGEEQEEERLVESSTSFPRRPIVGKKDLQTDGEHVFMLNAEADMLSVFDFDPESGSLTAKATGIHVPSADHFLVREDRIYVSRATEGGIVIFEVSEDGALHRDGRPPVTEGGLISPGVMIAVEDHLHVFDAHLALVSGFTIEDDGGLTPISEEPLELSLPGLDRVVHGGKQLFAFRDGSEEVVVLDMNGDGGLEEKDCSVTRPRPLSSLASSAEYLIAGSAESGTLDVVETEDECEVSVVSNALITRGSGPVYLAVSD